jgi:aquaporin Z
LLEALRRHWPEYLMEAAGLGLFMISACLFAAILEHPDSSTHRALAGEPTLRRVLVGLAMGLTAIGIVYSPWGQRSGAHLNPALTFTFWRLGKVAGPDAAFYAGAQFLGGAAGVFLMTLALPGAISHPAVNYAVTVPGARGAAVAFAAEAAISMGLMLVVLAASNSRRLHRYTGLLAGLLVATYISLEAPLSGMSMNPARTFASSLNARLWTSLWIYFTAPPLGMLLAAELYHRVRGLEAVRCAKLNHENRQRCIFRCNFAVHRAG